MSSIRKPRQIPDRKTRVRIAAHAGLDERTVGRYLQGRTRPHPLTERAINDAARALGVQLEVRP